MSIIYLTGDATLPQHGSSGGEAAIVHLCNDAGKWGAGFTGAVSKRFGNWPQRVYSYHQRYWLNVLGHYSIASITDTNPLIYVVNIVAQKGTRKRGEKLDLVDYDALETALLDYIEWNGSRTVTVHMPRIGTGLAGGDWAKIEPIIERTLVAAGMTVKVYDLETRKL